MSPLAGHAQSTDPTQLERKCRRSGPCDLAGLCFVQHVGIQQRHERTCEYHVIGGAQVPQDRGDLQGIAADGGRSRSRHRFECLAHAWRQ